MSHQTMAAMGDMATNFIPSTGGFDNSGEYKGALNPGGSFAFNAKTLNTQAAVQNALAFGGGGLPHGLSRAAGILPAAVKIGEYKQMQEVAEKYYEKYIKNFNRKYGFTPEQTQELITEFEDVTGEIKQLIPAGEMRDMYAKYIESYPTMYLSMIPAEALQMKLAVKCATENRNLRKKIEEMSKCVSTLVKNLTAMQIEAGIPPIVNLMFESMPDPLTAMTDPMYYRYNDAIVTYHKLLEDTTDSYVEDDFMKTFDSEGNENTLIEPVERRDLLRKEPLLFLRKMVENKKDGIKDPTDPSKTKMISNKEMSDLLEIMTNMQTQTGCQPFGAEWDHRGPTPPMNPNMCLDPKDKFQPGNPRNDQGRTMLYQAKRDPATGQAQWVPAGNIPAVGGASTQVIQPPTMPQQQMQMSMPMGQPQMAQAQQQQQQQQQMYAQSMPVGNFNQEFPQRKSKDKKKTASSSKNKPKSRPRSSSNRNAQ